MAPVLRQIGIQVVFGGTGRARRSVTLFPPTVDAGEKPSPPAPLPPAKEINGLDVPVGVSVATGPPGRPPPAERGDGHLSAAEATVTATGTPKSLDLRDGAGCAVFSQINLAGGNVMAVVMAMGRRIPPASRS